MMESCNSIIQCYLQQIPATTDKLVKLYHYLGSQTTYSGESTVKDNVCTQLTEGPVEDGGSKLGTSSHSRWQSCAYKLLYFGSSKALSKI